MNISLQDITEAKNRFGEVVKHTPLEYSERLSKKYKANIYLKREDLQKVRSYKIRGAYNLISSLSETEKQKGVVCASAGNHAQGFALSCSELKIHGVVYMPVTTPEQKVYKTRQFGGKFVRVVLVGDTFDQALAEAKKFESENGATFVHPFDDLRIITGQATIGLELYEELENIDVIVAPIGGGGVISGLISARNTLNKTTKIFGVEPAGASSMKTSLENNQNTTLGKIDTFVDGASVARVGENNFQICHENNIEVITCPENRICSTILEFLREDGIVLEPAGAIESDALKSLAPEIAGKTVVVIVSGGNLDFERLPEIKERSLRYEGKKRYYLVKFPQRPGALKDFLEFLGPDDDIARFEYLKKSNRNTAPVLIGIEALGAENFGSLEDKMSEGGFTFEDITKNDMYFNLLV
ncbi:threonine ammonia-lyase IlvA [Candidatus Gracilibacteria bacterium]|nr:threonine ammonia-lyase IlvA [Candidatus Gracilibacteria bacterium]